MAQVEMTVSIDAQRQEQIERYCALSGVSKKQTINDIMDMWEKFVYLPLMDIVEKEERRRKAREAFQRQREKAENGETPDMTMEEIDAIIAKVRTERYAKKEKR